MKTLATQITCLALVLLLSGCIFSRSKGGDRAVYDLRTAENKCQVPVCAGDIKNASGSDRRFLYRGKDNKISFDAGNYWLLDPEQAVSRLLRRSFVSDPENGVSVSGVIDDFGFDLEKKTAILTVNFTLSKDGRRKSVRCSSTSPFDGKSAKSAALAMNDCASQMVKELTASLEAFDKSGSKK